MNPQKARIISISGVRRRGGATRPACSSFSPRLPLPCPLPSPAVRHPPRIPAPGPFLHRAPLMLMMRALWWQNIVANGCKNTCLSLQTRSRAARRKNPAGPGPMCGDCGNKSIVWGSLVENLLGMQSYYWIPSSWYFLIFGREG